MLAPILAAVLFSRQSIERVELENGVALTVGEHRGAYWSCEDTYLDVTQPNQNYGDSAVLEGGPGHTILIKFGDLESLGRRKVTKATLFLTASEGGKASLSSVRRVLTPWGEGPLRRPFFTNKPLTAAQWSATWRNRRADPDGIAWQQGGASGSGDSEVVAGAKMEATATGIAITGIEPVVQDMLDRWYDNHGLALTFSAPIEFFSSKNNGGRPRLELELADEPAASGPDLSVTLIEAKYSEPVTPESPWPKDGSGVTYIAHIQNLGTAPAQGFSGSWTIREKPGSSFDVPKALAPGEETTVEVKRTFKMNDSDHRLQPLGFRITPKGPDSQSRNDYLEIQEDAIPFVAGLTSDGPDSPQRQFRWVNDVLLAQSRFSFAPEGCVERFRIAGFSKDAKPPMLKSILKPWSAASYDFMNPKVEKLAGRDVSLASVDRWMGQLGGGFTANDISVPGEIQLPFEAYYDQVFDNFELAPTGLLAASEVWSLDSNLGVPLGSRTFLKLPPTVLLRILNLDGDPLANAALSLYQTQNGEIKDGPPVLKLTTGDNGTVLLPSRAGSDGKTDQFGGLEPNGSNGVYLVACSFNGVTDYRWIKAWQLSDSYVRTGKAAVFSELRFNVPSDIVDTSVDLAANRSVTDSDKDPASKLSALVDGDTETSVELPNSKDSWLEIDLGRDREITEIDLLGKNPEFWNRFDILTYFTGQKPQDARPFAHEVDWGWNLHARPDLAGPGLLSMPYRGSGKGVRYIRLVCKEPSNHAPKLSEIRVYGAKTSD
jgi:hypothetical protein